MPSVLPAHHLKALKLPTFLREYDKQARQCAAKGVDPTGCLLRLSELERLDRERRLVERRTGALLDRLTHHVHILAMNGKSYRRRHSKQHRQHASTHQPPA